ncbi:PTS transporter subunit EIIC [Brevinema andersonii]|uniref:PTS transporter subunit EIIC n=1 Tax=Brevinema andersonii TaxID=34097 RepID=UPI000B8703AF|nr:PTS transporter subunit EIIC [Brevinema andersonii]
MFKEFQKIGKSFMLPIAVLPAAGLLLGIGGALSNTNIIGQCSFSNQFWLQGIFKVMAASRETIFANLAILLCIGIVIGLAQKDKGTVALSAAAAFLVMNTSIKGMIAAFNPDGNPIDTGVTGAIVMGLLVSHLHNRFHQIQLPSILGFFSRLRFVLIVSSFAAMVVGFLFFLIWPIFQSGLINTGRYIAKLGPFGPFLYGFLLRLTGAVGLHHMIYPLFWLTELGGVEQVAGTTVIGAQNIFFSQLADPNHSGIFTEGKRFFVGRFGTMIFGLPTVADNKKAQTAGLFLSAAATSFITGIIEPIEFMFLFVTPLLYILHAFFDGFSFFVADILNISIGNTFSGGLIDFLLPGVLQGNTTTNWILVPIVGVFWFMLYFFSFKYLIKVFNIMTPGRELDSEEIRVITKDSLQQTATDVLAALGGKENIDDVDACITRLRVNVKNISKVNQEKKSLGATAVLEVHNSIQAIFGAMADPLKQRINNILENSGEAL